MPLYNVLFTNRISYVKEIEADSPDEVYEQLEQFPNFQGIIDGQELVLQEHWGVELI